jgi:hypothetical protein
MTLYARWILASMSESFEEFPTDLAKTGVSSAYSLYTGSVSGYDKANVKSGSTSIFRNGSSSGTKSFTICRDDDTKLAVGEQYTITFYVKPTKVSEATGVINLIEMNKKSSISTPTQTTPVKTVGDLKVGEWQKVSYTFTAKDEYIGISTTTGNDMYFDSFSVTLSGHVGSATGDNSISPIIIVFMLLLAAGAVVVTSKKVFAK